jgi:hypothetical protein
MLKLCSYLYSKRDCPTKNVPQQQEISSLKREREGRAGRSAGRQFSRQAGIINVRFGLGEIEGRDRDTEK